MKVKYLGSAAYEGIPTLFCNCYACRIARIQGGQNVRSRQQMLINDDLLMDFGPDTLSHTQKYGLDWTKIHNCLVTHSHSDHFYVEDFGIITNYYSHQNNKVFNIYAGEETIKMINSYFSNNDELKELQEIGKQQIVHHGDKINFDGYNVLVLKANHAESTSPLIYMIEKDNKRMLYAHDTGIFPNETFKLLENAQLDFISIDCTGCTLPNWRDHHLSLETVVETINKLKEINACTSKTIVVISHFSHNSGSTHLDLLKAAKEYGYIVAYDGLEIDF